MIPQVVIDQGYAHQTEARVFGLIESARRSAWFRRESKLRGGFTMPRLDGPQKEIPESM
jgi:hypothetical protein